jgi:hypothetical protein
MELLVSYQRGHYRKARREIEVILARLGDSQPSVGRTAVDGIARAATTLDARDVVRWCSELFHRGLTFEHAIKWIPVDYWCAADMQAIRRVLVEKVRDRIGPEGTWGLNRARPRITDEAPERQMYRAPKGS